MLHLRTLAICGIMGAAFASPVAAADADADRRFSLERTEDGFLRFDRRTGDVLHCRQDKSAWDCASLTDTEDAHQAGRRAERLARENAELRARIASLERRLERQRGTRAEDRLDLPSDQDLDRLMDMMEKMMRRFMSFVRSLDWQVEREI